MSTSLIQSIDILSREKGIDPEVIIAAIEDAVIAAARKQYRTEKTGEELRARYDRETGEVELFALMTVVEEVQNPATDISLADVTEMGVEGAEVGDQLEFPKPPGELGRIAAQTAKQIIFQKVREAERKNVYDEYIGRLGELVHGFVKRFEGGRIIVDLGKIEAVLSKMQQSRAESFSQGERIRVVIHDVSTETRGPQVEVSRTSPELLKRLFEMEVPEIYDGTVQIKAAVREPGDRAKIAVISTERDVDPVGACVGMKGSRVQAIIRELRGERIDIIEWNEDPAVFAANALSPAKVSKVEINSFEDKRLTVTVPEDQLSLAIGKKGQNVRLGAKLVGWHVDIRSAEEAAREAAAQLEAVMAGGAATLADIRESLALDQITAERLKGRGITNIEELVVLTVDDLVDAIDVSFDQANEILDRAHRLLAQKHAREVMAAREAEAHEAAPSPEGEEQAAVVEAAEAATAEGAEESSAAPTEETEQTEAGLEGEAQAGAAEAEDLAAMPMPTEEAPQAETGAEEESEAEAAGIEETEDLAAAPIEEGQQAEVMAEEGPEAVTPVAAQVEEVEDVAVMRVEEEQQTEAEEEAGPSVAEAAVEEPAASPEAAGEEDAYLSTLPEDVAERIRAKYFHREEAAEEGAEPQAASAAAGENESAEGGEQADEERQEE